MADNCSCGGKRFAIGQPVPQNGCQMPSEKRPARILGRSHAPLALRPTTFPNLSFYLLNDFVVVDWHGCSLSLEFQILNLSLAPCHSSLLIETNER
jgi:hypothetical protein